MHERNTISIIVFLMMMIMIIIAIFIVIIMFLMISICFLAATVMDCIAQIGMDPAGVQKCVEVFIIND